ncbi:hypothetical protein [Devriesea agamarum]|uniref:hypothetical protein n=1 Tax=Devriesea agamarum TaxID=472569 RepID=UPI00071CBD68|nr:hypothetical protein [Devriesea agamarum]
MSHRLEVPSVVSVDDIEALILNRFPHAERRHTMIRVTRTASLTQIPGTGTWTLTVRRERESAPEAGVTDRRGYARAFPDGLPWREERKLLDLLHSIARRTGGRLVTDSGATLVPHRYSVPDLQVIAGDRLLRDETLEIIQDIVPEARLDELPEGVVEDELDGYRVVIPLRDDAEVHVLVSSSEPVPIALAKVDWVRESFVAYAVVYAPHDEEEREIELPDRKVAQRWREAYFACATIAKRLHEVLGGFVIDGEGFLVDPKDLT